MTVDPELGGAAAPTSARQDTRRVELTPLPGLTQQFTMQVEQEIQKQIEEHSRQLVQDILKRSTNQGMPPTPSEAAWASLSQCFQKALAPSRAKPAPPPEQLRGLTKRGPAQYSLADPFAGINPPPPEVLRESHSDQSARGRATMCLEWTQEEKKTISSSHPRGEANPKRGWSSGAKPSWDVSKVGGWQTDRARSQPANEPETPASTPKLKSVVKSVRLKLSEPEDLEGFGPAAGANMMTPPKMISHGEKVPDTVPTPTANRAPAQLIKVQVILTGDPGGLTRGLARGLTRDFQGTRKKACLLN